MKISSIAFLLTTAVSCISIEAWATPPQASAEQTQQQQGAPKGSAAIKLAGLVTFVASSCPDLKADYDRFKTVVSALGVSLEELSKDDMKLQYLNYAAIYQKDVAGNCALAKARFGTAGTTVPGLFQPK